MPRPPTTAPPSPSAEAPGATRRGPAASDPVDSSAPVRALRDELDRLFGAPALEHATWSATIQSLDTGEVLYELNSTKLLMPASNMKIVTMAVAAERLGWDFTFDTRLVSTASIDDGVLRGDLIAVGSGDPSIAARDELADRAFTQLADGLRAAGISEIEGRLVGNDNTFDDVGLGSGWSWDYLGDGYATGVGGLQFNENVAPVALQPGRAVGAPIVATLSIPDTGLTLVNQATTSARGVPGSLGFRRLAGSSTLVITGSIPIGAPPFTRFVSVDNPTTFFVQSLKSALEMQGIAVRGAAVDIDDAGDAARLDEASATGRTLASISSPPLRELGETFMKISQNVYGETLLRALGGAAGPRTVEQGRTAIRDVLTAWGIPPDTYVVADGSGLSRYNYLNTSMLAAILRQMHRDPRHAEAFEETLPVAGRHGTLERRFKGTRAEGRVRAKTGSIAHARALSGYLETLDGERLAFSIIANNFTLPPSVVEGVIDRAVERLANFSKR